MKPLHKVLAVINPTTAEQPALEAALALAGQYGSDLYVLIRKQHATENTLSKLDAFLAFKSTTGIRINLIVCDERNLVNAIINTADQYAVNVIVKERHSDGQRSLLLPIDWLILRKAKCAVLMLSHNHQWKDEKVLLAINAAPEDRVHDALNHYIAEVGKRFVDTFDCPVEIVSAYPSMMQSGDAEASTSPEAIAKQYREECLRLASEYDLSPQEIHVDAGPAEILISNTAHASNAGLVILGTAARRGLRGWMLGNTAEQILSRLEAGLLVLPPPSESNIG